MDPRIAEQFCDIGAGQLDLRTHASDVWQSSQIPAEQLRQHRFDITIMPDTASRVDFRAVSPECPPGNFLSLKGTWPIPAIVLLREPGT
jgi:hypothetical protein